MNDKNQIIQNQEDVKTDKISPSVFKPFFSNLSTATVSPILKKVEIIETIIPKAVRVKRMKKDRDEAKANKVQTSGICSKKVKSKKLTKLAKSIRIGPYK